MKTIAVALLLAMTSSCATHRYGREMPLTDAERAALTCEQIEVEISKVEAFLAQIQEGVPTNAAVLGVLGDFGIGNAMERNAAHESGERRLLDLQELRYAKGCPGAEKPATPAPELVVIASLLPDPIGSDGQNEVVTLRNAGESSVSLAGWTLRNSDGQSMDLSIHGSIAPMASLDILRNGSRLSLDNEGGSIRLLDDEGVTVDEVSYGSVAEGQVVQGH